LAVAADSAAPTLQQTRNGIYRAQARNSWFATHVMQEKVYKGQIKDVDELRSSILPCLDELDQRVRLLTPMTWQSGSGARVFLRVLKRKADTY